MTMQNESPSWRDFLAARKAERQACDAPRPLRALAEELGARVE